MSIQLLSISHKTTPLEIREKFAFDDEKKLKLLENLVLEDEIEEAVVLSTCNRTEVYCKTRDNTDEGKNFSIIKNHVLSIADACYIKNIEDYILMYQDAKAVHHLFRVTAGLDSMVIGEDQILGQVKQAYEFSHNACRCKTIMNTLFRYAITCAKKIKTDTVISKTSISTATLALKAAEEKLGSLRDKNIMIIGASGKIGRIVLKNALSIKNAQVYATSRSHSIHVIPGGHSKYTTIPYDERYKWLDSMDVIISSTSSPHYTITKNHVLCDCYIQKPRVYVDLAVPLDIDPEIGKLPETYYYNIEDMRELARVNNERKLADVNAADEIIKAYEEDFDKWLLYHMNLEEIDKVKSEILAEACAGGVEKAVNHFVYGLKEYGDAEDIRAFMRLLKIYNLKGKND